MEIEIFKILSLLSNMYLSSPTREALTNWQSLLSGEVPDLLSDLKKVIDQIDQNSKQELDDLVWEYTRLFIGPHKLPCPPWESVYTSGKRLMMQEAYDEVQKLYCEIGLTVNDPGIMADHIAAELNFLSVLYEKMIVDPEHELFYLAITRRVFKEHLDKWIDQFTSDLEEAAVSRFYKTLAQVTRNLARSLSNSLPEPDRYE